MNYKKKKKEFYYKMKKWELENQKDIRELKEKKLKKIIMQNLKKQLFQKLAI